MQGARLERLWPGQPCSVLTERADGSTGLIAITRHAVESEAVALVQMVALARDSEFIDPASFGPIVHRLSWDGACGLSDGIVRSCGRDASQSMAGAESALSPSGISLRPS